MSSYSEQNSLFTQNLKWRQGETESERKKVKFSPKDNTFRWNKLFRMYLLKGKNQRIYSLKIFFKVENKNPRFRKKIKILWEAKNPGIFLLIYLGIFWLFIIPAPGYCKLKINFQSLQIRDKMVEYNK